MKLFHYQTDFLPWLNLSGKIVTTIGVGSPFIQGGASNCQILLRFHLPGCLAYRLGWQAPVTGPQVARDQRKFGLREPKSSFLLSATGVQLLALFARKRECPVQTGDKHPLSNSANFKMKLEQKIFTAKNDSRRRRRVPVWREGVPQQSRDQILGQRWWQHGLRSLLRASLGAGCSKLGLRI